MAAMRGWSEERYMRATTLRQFMGHVRAYLHDRFLWVSIAKPWLKSLGGAVGLEVDDGGESKPGSAGTSHGQADAPRSAPSRRARSRIPGWLRDEMSRNPDIKFNVSDVDDKHPLHVQVMAANMARAEGVTGEKGWTWGLPSAGGAG